MSAVLKRNTLHDSSAEDGGAQLLTMEKQTLKVGMASRLLSYTHIHIGYHGNRARACIYPASRFLLCPLYPLLWYVIPITQCSSKSEDLTWTDFHSWLL